MNPIYPLVWQLIVMALAVWVGFAIARRWRKPARSRTWVLVIAGLLVSPTIGTTTYLILINGFGIVIGWNLFALLLGILLCMALRKDATRPRPKSPVELI